MKRKILRNLLIGSSVIILSISIPLAFCLSPKKQNINNNSSIINNETNHKVINSNHVIVKNTNNITNTLNNNSNYYFHDGFYTKLFSNENVVTISGITYSLNNSNSSACIISINNNISNLIIPGVIIANNSFYNVTSIANGACFNKQLSSVSFPNSIVSIGADAFANNLLTNLTLPVNLQTLGNNSFSNNPFSVGTVISLPSKCSWNKNANLCPFNNNNNAGSFNRCVKYIIQNLAVYGYLYQSNSWQIVSWMPQVANLIPYEVKADNNIFTQTEQITNEVTQKATNNTFNIPPLSLNNVSLVDNVIGIQYGNYLVQAYGFNVSNNNVSFYWTNNNFQPGSDFVITISNPNTNQQVYNSNSGNYTSNSVPIQYGDVVQVYYNEGPQDESYRLLTGETANQAINNLSNCAISQYFCYDYSSNNGTTNKFIVTQDGLIPYQSVMHVNVNCLQENVTNFNLTGIALADHIITATINGQSYQALSNNNGQFSIPISTNSPLSLGTNVTVTCSGCLTYTGQLIGDNPINSGILFECGGDFGILPDGYTGTYQLWNASSTSMPLFNNPQNSSNDSYSSSNSIIPNDTALNMTLTDSYVNIWNQTITSTININEPAGQNCASNLESELQNLTFNPLYTNTLTITIPNTYTNYLFSAIYNKNMISWQYSQQNNATTYTFTITNNQLYTDNTTSNTSTTGSENNYGFNQNWAARNFMVANYTLNGYGVYEDGYNKANFYDPTPLMWKTIKEITAKCENDYEKAVAINEWVYNNMTYTYTYTYGYTISQTFNHLEGVCGNFADLAAVMCMMAGMVSRVITGDCSNATSYFAPFSTNHCWIQVWDEQLGSWITLDPTWDWFFPYGDDQDEFNLCRSNMFVNVVFWPPKTNYFSYFANHMYAALLNYDDYFNVQGGNCESYYPMTYAAGLSQLLQSTTTITGDNSNVIN
ncbi:MAG: hypothetical protein IIT78_01985 [Mycoplasmataceae bacterium]|nr:hypothetical protein [Mycoplasmataceae bacterium]